MYNQYSEGWLEVICGCMFAGKTEELIRRINVLTFAKKKIIVFKPKIDNRYSETEIVSHAGAHVPCVVVSKATDILENIQPDTDVVAIDEVQFFDQDVVDVCEYLADSGLRVMVAGLDKDFRGEPFGVLPDLLTRAEFVTKLTAVCASMASLLALMIPLSWWELRKLMSQDAVIVMKSLINHLNSRKSNIVNTKFIFIQ